MNITTQQIIVTSIGELSSLIQKAHLMFGDNADTQINIHLNAKDGGFEISTPTPFHTIAEQPVNDQYGH